MTTKELVTIEFRYLDVSKYEGEADNKNKTITIGVYNTFEEAIQEGNKVLEVLESRFNLNPNCNRKERFSKNGGSFGSSKKLITNLAYLKTSFDFYAKITTLYYNDLNSTIDEVMAAEKRYREAK